MRLTRLRTLWEGVGSGLWFLPVLLATGAVLLAWTTLTWSDTLTARFGDVWWLHSGSADTASDLLSSLLTAMITLAALAFSITMVVLTLAAGQLGPRLIRSFMADKRTQLMLGCFLATIVYLVLVLRSVTDEAEAASVPHLAVSVGTLAVLVSVFLLLFFVHHLARSIVADTVVQRIGLELDAAAERLLPDRSSEHDQARDRPNQEAAGAGLTLDRGGYVQAVNYDSLVRCAREANALIDLRFRPGHHLLPHGEHGRVHPASALSDSLREELVECVVVGAERTANQDLEFALRQLVEIALRALSTGVNDPFTAIAVVDRLGVSLARIMRREIPRGLWCDEDGEVRVMGPTPAFSGLVDAAFNQIRQAADDQPAILIRLMGTLAQLGEQADREEHRHVLLEHVAATSAAGTRSISEDYDLAAFDERRARALAYLQHA